MIVCERNNKEKVDALTNIFLIVHLFHCECLSDRAWQDPGQHCSREMQDANQNCTQVPRSALSEGHGPKWMSGVEVSDDGAYLLLRISEGCQPANRLFHCRLPSGDKWTADVIASTVAANGLLSFEVLADNFDGEYDYIANDGASFVFHTNLDAPLKRLVRIDLSQADPSESCKGVAQRRGWTELVPESSTAVLEWCAPVRKDRLVLCYLEDVKSALYLHDLATGALIRPLPLPIGTVCGFSGRRTQSELFYKHTGFLSPGVIYRLDLTDETNTPSEHYVTPVKGFDLAEFTTKQVFVTSKDGHTRVPMFLVSRADVALDGRNPTLLYGYGGFNISITPSYSVSRLIFMRHYGGVLAVANIRGGGYRYNIIYNL